MCDVEFFCCMVCVVVLWVSVFSVVLCGLVWFDLLCVVCFVLCVVVCCGVVFSLW